MQYISEWHGSVDRNIFSYGGGAAVAAATWDGRDDLKSIGSAKA